MRSSSVAANTMESIAHRPLELRPGSYSRPPRLDPLPFSSSYLASASKAAASYTRPGPRDVKAAASSRLQSYAVDPVDLARRLHLVLAQQQAATQTVLVAPVSGTRSRSRSVSDSASDPESVSGSGVSASRSSSQTTLGVEQTLSGPCSKLGSSSSVNRSAEKPGSGPCSMAPTRASLSSHKKTAGAPAATAAAATQEKASAAGKKVAFSPSSAMPTLHKRAHRRQASIPLPLVPVAAPKEASQMMRKRLAPSPPGLPPAHAFDPMGFTGGKAGLGSQRPMNGDSRHLASHPYIPRQAAAQFAQTTARPNWGGRRPKATLLQQEEAEQQHRLRRRASLGTAALLTTAAVASTHNNKTKEGEREGRENREQKASSPGRRPPPPFPVQHAFQDALRIRPVHCTAPPTELTRQGSVAADREAKAVHVEHGHGGSKRRAQSQDQGQCPAQKENPRPLARLSPSHMAAEWAGKSKSDDHIDRPTEGGAAAAIANNNNTALLMSEHHVDWTQRDEEPPRERTRERLLPTSKSLWALRERLSSTNRPGKESAPTATAAPTTLAAAGAEEGGRVDALSSTPSPSPSPPLTADTASPGPLGSPKGGLKTSRSGFFTLFKH